MATNNERLTGMDRPQFSLLRLMGAVTCCAVALGMLFGNLRFPPGRLAESMEMVMPVAFAALPGLAVWLLSNRVWAALLVSGIILFVLCAPIV